MVPSALTNGFNGQNGHFERRLVAIAFVDIVGYSTLMAEDEDNTHAQWMAVKRDIIERQLGNHRGHLVKSTGDGVLVEFAAVLNAVAWAREVQAAMRNMTDAVTGKPLELRIAVHLCEVIDDETDIYGDGVNIAARLQEYAPPGGIIVSETVHDIARVAIDLEAKDLGRIPLKNIASSPRAFIIDPSLSDIARAKNLRQQALPSIAILPLQNLGADPADSYFADGIVEDIIVSLSGLRELLVISRGSTSVYGAQQPDPCDVGRTFGVRYVLMGTMRRSAHNVRVSIQLCDAESGTSLWADRYAVSHGDLFDVQDEIVDRIVAGIAPNVRTIELRQAMRKKPENFSAYDHTLRALETIHSLDLKTFMHARKYLEQSIAIDPNFAMSVAWLARWHSLYIGQGWSNQPDDDAAKGLRHATKALELDQQNSLALATYGHMKSFLFHDYDDALTYLDRARSVGPSYALAWILSSGTLCYVGRTKEAVQCAKRGLRLSPYDRSLFYSYFFLGIAYYGSGEYESAARWCRMSYSENPHYTANLRILTASLIGCREVDDAREIVQLLMRMEPDFSIERYRTSRQPFRDEKIKKTYLKHLQQAGFPD